MDYLQEQLDRGHKFEHMLSTDGWKLVTAFYTNKLADLANRMFTGSGDISVFQAEVDEVRGLRKLIESISHDVDILNEQRQSTAVQTPEPATE